LLLTNGKQLDIIYKRRRTGKYGETAANEDWTL